MSHFGHERQFDWDEAARLYWSESWSIVDIAEWFGVTPQSIRRVVIPGEAQKAIESRERWWKTKLVCPDCGGPMSRGSGSLKTTRCQKCWAATIRTSVREDELRCSRCEQWLPDEAFGRARNRVSRRKRKHMCRSCEAAYLREWRLRKQESS